MVEQAIRATRLHLVGARAVEALHEHVAVLQRVHGLEQHLRRDLEARVVFAQILERDGDHGNVREAHSLQCLADKRDVVGGAATAARLRDEHGKLVGVIAPRHDGFHNLAGDQDGRIADVVVHVLKARIDRAVVHARQKLDVVAEAAENGHEKLEMVRRHLRSQDGVALLLHLLGEHRARELRVGALALAHALLSLGRGLLVERIRDSIRRDLDVARGAACGLRGAFGLFIGLILQGSKEAAHADARGAQVGHLVDFKHGVHLARRLENFLHLVGGERVQTATERVQLDEVEVATLGRHLRRRIEARVVHPLVDQANRALERAQVRDGVLGEHRQPKAREQLGDGVVDLGVVMVGAARQHDAVGAGLLHPFQGLGALHAHVALERLVLGPSGVDRGVHFLLRRGGNAFAHELGVRLDKLHHQALLQVFLLVVGQPRVQELRRRLAQLVDVQAQRLGVARHDRAVEMVARRVVLLALPLAAGEPDEVRVLVEQVHDVAVRELRRVAHALRRHGFDARLVGLLRGRVGKHHAPSELREEGEPERVVLVHVERTGNAHRAARGLASGKRRVVVEQALALVLEEVRHLLRLLVERAGALLAAVARDEAAVFAGVLVLAEIVHREQAGVRAALAAHGLMRGSERFDLLEGKQRGFDLRGDDFGVGGSRFDLRGGGSRGRATLRSFAAFAPLTGVFRLIGVEGMSCFSLRRERRLRGTERRLRTRF